MIDLCLTPTLAIHQLYRGRTNMIKFRHLQDP